MQNTVLASNDKNYLIIIIISGLEQHTQKQIIYRDDDADATSQDAFLS